MKTIDCCFKNEHGEESLPVYEWNKNHQLKIFIETSLGDIKVCKFKYNKKGCIYYHPQNKSDHGFSIDSDGNKKVFGIEEITDHNYISFHASGRIKGPDYSLVEDGYKSFEYRLDQLERPHELFELYPTYPGAYNLYNESDNARSAICKLTTPKDIKDYTPKIFFDIVNLEHFKTSKVFKWDKKYYAAYIMKNLESGPIVLLIGLSFLKMDIPKENLIRIKIGSRK